MNPDFAKSQQDPPAPAVPGEPPEPTRSLPLQSLSVTFSPVLRPPGGVSAVPMPSTQDFWIALRTLLWIICVVLGTFDAVGFVFMYVASTR